jgi:hypothetical protein
MVGGNDRSMDHKGPGQGRLVAVEIHVGISVESQAELIPVQRDLLGSQDVANAQQVIELG